MPQYKFDYNKLSKSIGLKQPEINYSLNYIYNDDPNSWDEANNLTKLNFGGSKLQVRFYFCICHCCGIIYDPRSKLIKVYNPFVAHAPLYILPNCAAAIMNLLNLGNPEIYKKERK